jgi:hypothetical protein
VRPVFIPPVLISAFVVLAGCGADGARKPARPLAKVGLQITAPADGATVRAATVDVEGRVNAMSAAVAVLGRPARVSGGVFSAVVPLDPGANVIDVIATAPHRSPALAAIRVMRDVNVIVPQLAGVTEDDVQGQLDALGLHADVKHGGDIFEIFRSGKRAVCQQDPQPGASVRRGSTVHVVVAKQC